MFKSIQSLQLEILRDLYSQHGLELKMTCSSFPEQYDVFKENKQVGYLRLRFGEFRVDCGDTTLYETKPDGFGIFEDHERLHYMRKALDIILNQLSNEEGRNQTQEEKKKIEFFDVDKEMEFYKSGKAYNSSSHKPADIKIYSIPRKRK